MQNGQESDGHHSDKDLAVFILQRRINGSVQVNGTNRLYTENWVILSGFPVWCLNFQTS